ncbi:MAG: VCBS repeat-containing protein, partial [Pseudomonadota bacterium]
YIDRPHLAKTLRIWRFRNNALTEVAAQQGYSNHKIGWPYIVGGIRDCGAGPEMILATGNWSRIMAARLQDGAVFTRDLGNFWNVEGLNDAMLCRP